MNPATDRIAALVAIDLARNIATLPPMPYAPRYVSPAVVLLLAEAIVVARGTDAETHGQEYEMIISNVARVHQIIPECDRTALVFAVLSNAEACKQSSPRKWGKS